MATALLQAGGKSERMRRTSGPGHKALRNVLGVPLLERNLCRLLVAGFSSITIVTSEAESSIQHYVSSRGSRLAKSRGISLHTLVEQKPLGTIGAAAMLPQGDCPVLVLYSDNLTSLDFRKLVDAHQVQCASMTLATHEEPFQIPFGEVVSEGGRVVDYREKSIHPIRVSSGIYVLGKPALECLQEGERVDSPHLVHRLLKKSQFVLDYPHEELWIDMNDARRHLELEQLIYQYPRRLDCLQTNADREGHLVVSRDERERLFTEVLEEAVLSDSSGATLPSIGTFDEIDVQDGNIVRWTVHVSTASVDHHQVSESCEYDDGSKEARAIAYANAYFASSSDSNAGAAN